MDAWIGLLDRPQIVANSEKKKRLKVRSKKSPTGPTERTPRKPKYLIAGSQLTERCQLGFGPIQFLMDDTFFPIHFPYNFHKDVCFYKESQVSSVAMVSHGKYISR